ncbi:MAG: hypothetical protein U0441_33930 [Polyangiaceae bacterium]
MPKKTIGRKGAKASAPKAKKAKAPSARKPAEGKTKKSAAKPAKVAKAPKAKVKAKGKSAKTTRGVSHALASVTAPTEAVIREERGSSGPLKRKLGLRGAAPWAARHAAKHAAEARARAAQPAPPGSARATIRVPQEAEQIKAKISELFNQTTKIRTLRKRLDRGFFEIGEILHDIQQSDLHQAKGYGTFEAFLEREIDLGKQTSLKLIKIAHIFQQDAALDYGMDRCIQALAALEGELLPKAAPSAPGSAQALPLKPPMRIMGT